MIWVDNAVVALLAIYTISGLLRGFSQEVFSLIVWFIAIVVALFFCQDFTVLLVKKMGSPKILLALSFIALIVITLVFGWMINMLLAESVKKSGLSTLNRLGGIMLGLIHGMVVVFALVLVAGLTPLPKDRWWQESKYLPPFQSFAVVVRSVLPSKLQSSINYR